MALPAAMFRAGHAAAPTLTCDDLQLAMVGRCMLTLSYLGEE